MLINILSTLCVAVFAPMILFQVGIGMIVCYVAKWRKKKAIAKFGLNLCISADQNGNVVLLGHPDETISSRLGRANYHHTPKWYAKLARVAVDKGALVFGDGPEHCKNAIETKNTKIYEYVDVWSWYK